MEPGKLFLPVSKLTGTMFIFAVQIVDIYVPQRLHFHTFNPSNGRSYWEVSMSTLPEK